MWRLYKNIIIAGLVLLFGGCVPNNFHEPVSSTAMSVMREDELDRIVQELSGEIASHAMQVNRLNEIVILPGSLKGCTAHYTRLEEILVERLRNSLSSTCNLRLYSPDQQDMAVYCRDGILPMRERALIIYEVCLDKRRNNIVINVNACHTSAQKVCIRFSEKKMPYKTGTEAFRLYRSSPDKSYAAMCKENLPVVQHTEHSRIAYGAREESEERNNASPGRRRHRHSSGIIDSATPKKIMSAEGWKVCFQDFPQSEFSDVRPVLSSIAGRGNIQEAGTCRAPGKNNCHCFFVQGAGSLTPDVIHAALIRKFQRDGVALIELQERVLWAKRLKYIYNCGRDD